MRRRPKAVQGAFPPPELCTFRLVEWADFAPPFDPRVDFDGCCADEPLRQAFRAFQVFSDAQKAWRDQHGWPVDGLDFIRDRVQLKLALMTKDRATVGPGPALASALRGQYRPGFS